MKSNPLEVAAEIVATFVSNNSIPASDVPALIESLHSAFVGFVEAGTSSAAPVNALMPAVPIRKSITPDYLICLDDGKRFKSLRRHLALLGMTPEQYRQKWSLPPDYPMVAANYAMRRSELAKRIGLGQMHGKSVGIPTQATTSRKVGRPRKKT